ncbi:glycerophosphodiester phosphodiesterase 1 [Trichogramma pretiosum]|uniref:glycerophosphodiester phosphodiesterase 1 n=1 Tax=Trichogramma pretiosum TaxID=7493 RepID=UPI0006C9A099|nr:glycerophosphodiester phosphodiesterase 1 [Trichogramma pretiosum]
MKILKCLEIGSTAVLLWLYLETIFSLIIDCFYFTLPWFVWGAIAVIVLMKFFIHVPTPNDVQVKKFLGIDPLEIDYVADFMSFDNILCENEEDEKENEYDDEKKEELRLKREEDDKNCIRVCAHRGAGFDYPENSLSAFRNAYQKGVGAIEFDLALTKDNVPILFHDTNIDRLTGFEGNISDMTWNDLQAYDISATHCLREKLNLHGERIASFEEVLVETLKNGQRMFIDIKASGNEIVNVVLDAFKKYPDLYNQAAISSFNPLTVYNIRKKDPKIIAGMAYRPGFFTYFNYNGQKGPWEPRYNSLHMHLLASMMDLIHDWAFPRLTYYLLGLSFVLLHKDLISPEVVRLWNNREVRVFAWTVNLSSEKTHFLRNLKVSYLTDTLLS